MAKELKEIIDEEFLRLNSLLILFKNVEEIIKGMRDEDEYDRAKKYISDRFDHQLSYNHNRFKKEE